MSSVATVTEVIDTDMCVGCGLCETATSGRVRMVMTPGGSLRPDDPNAFTPGETEHILLACPGVVAAARADPSLPVDPIWGHHGTMCVAWATDPEVRYRSATGGVLTALGMHVVEEGRASFVLHVGPDPEHPMRSRWVLSETAASVLANAGSRYGPTAPMAGLHVALDRGEPFAMIGKPCDIGALHRWARMDPRVDELCVARLTLVCGGQSRLTKSLGVLEELGVAEARVTLFRYRGHGNPGATRIETADGCVHEKSYLDLWEDEASWDLETRCKLCPDALGEAADVAAADIWPGGAPTGEDAGFNGIVVRSAAGEELVADAAAAGRLTLGEPIDPRYLDDTQPHQVRKKHALRARFEGMRDAGVAPITTHGLRVDELGAIVDPQVYDAERAGTARRLREARTR